MKKEKELKQAGITITHKLSTLENNKIASCISEKICQSFKEHNLNQTNLFASLTKIDMYFAKFQDNSAAKYNYKDNSIYFKEDIDFNNLETPAIHECLHFIQSVRNKNGKLIKLGLYTPKTFKSSGLALNEAAVQLMAAYATQSQEDNVKYYGMNLTTNSPNYYPIECALLRQMTYFTGTYPLFHSTLYSDDIFKNTFIMKSNEKTYQEIISNLDLIVECEEALHKENLYLSYIEYDETSSFKILNTQKNIETLKENIRELTIKTQELILTNCSYSDLELVRDNQSITEFKNKLYNFQNYLISTEDYTFFNSFYCEMMEKLEVKRELVRKYGVLTQFKDIRENLALIETRHESLNLFKLIIEKIKKLFHINQESISTESEKK